MPLFGSSEITRVSLNRASEFFKSAPTGFQVCPVGAAGNTPLLMLMKIASVGDGVRGHKMAVLLSPGWFTRGANPLDHYAGNFSALQAINMIENKTLSEGLKSRIAQRMLDYSQTLDQLTPLLLRVREQAGVVSLHETVEPLLDAALDLTAGGFSYADVIQSTLQLNHTKVPATWAAKQQELDWSTLFAEAAKTIVPSKRKVAVWNGARPSPLDAIRRREFASSEKGEWNDFALLLDTIKELQINALIISMPISGAREDLEGILPATRHECYYSRVESMCRERGVAVNAMESHDLDSDFLIDYVSHPSPVGWLHINRLLDDFWHDRFPPKT